MPKPPRKPADSSASYCDQPAHEFLGGRARRRGQGGTGVAQLVRPDRRQADGVGGAAEGRVPVAAGEVAAGTGGQQEGVRRSEEHTSELQSRQYLVCRLLLEKKKPDRSHILLYAI